MYYFLNITNTSGVALNPPTQELVVHYSVHLNHELQSTRLRWSLPFFENLLTKPRIQSLLPITSVTTRSILLLVASIVDRQRSLNQPTKQFLSSFLLNQAPIDDKAHQADRRPCMYLAALFRIDFDILPELFSTLSRTCDTSCKQKNYPEILDGTERVWMLWP